MCFHPAWKASPIWYTPITVHAHAMHHAWLGALLQGFSPHAYASLAATPAACPDPSHPAPSHAPVPRPPMCPPAPSRTGTQNKDGIKGSFWFLEPDLKDGREVKLDKSGKGLLTLMRHLGRLQEVREAPPAPPRRKGPPAPGGCKGAAVRVPTYTGAACLGAYLLASVAERMRARGLSHWNALRTQPMYDCRYASASTARPRQCTSSRTPRRRRRQTDDTERVPAERTLWCRRATCPGQPKIMLQAASLQSVHAGRLEAEAKPTRHDNQIR